MVFGGFLLKVSFELAFTCAAAFGQGRPTFVSLDPSTFKNPVPVGSVLYLSSCVVYTDDPPAVELSEVGGGAEGRKGWTRVHIRVNSEVRDVEHGTTKPTGQFNYTFLMEGLIEVVPQTYKEFMAWLDARRRAQLVDASDKATAKAPADENADQVALGR